MLFVDHPLRLKKNTLSLLSYYRWNREIRTSSPLTKTPAKSLCTRSPFKIDTTIGRNTPICSTLPVICSYSSLLIHSSLLPLFSIPYETGDSGPDQFFLVDLSSSVLFLHSDAVLLPTRVWPRKPSRSGPDVGIGWELEFLATLCGGETLRGRTGS